LGELEVSLSQLHQFASQQHFAVVATFRRNGAAQLSIVLCGPFRYGIAFTTTRDRAKYANLKRDPRCSLLLSHRDWRLYVVLEGRASILSSENTPPDELRQAFREVYRAAAGREHPDWEEYDRAMVADRRVIVVVEPERTYGTLH
jgi:PPOX class probable F420-dependent enzyme